MYICAGIKAMSRIIIPRADNFCVFFKSRKIPNTISAKPEK
jgi:hypothetical protein